MKKRGQMSVEYILIIGIALLIILPGIFLFRNYIFESNDKILGSRLTEIASQMLGKAQKMYYYGPPSKSTIQIDMPPEVDNMYVQNYTNEYYLIFTILTSTGRRNFEFTSEIPLKVPNNVTCNIDIECIGTCHCFNETYYYKGIKNFQMEAQDDCIGSDFCVAITEVSSDLP